MLGVSKLSTGTWLVCAGFDTTFCPAAALCIACDACVPHCCVVQVGGMGFIHYNCTIAEQAAAVAKVKAHIPGFVVTPVCMKPTDPISALDNLKVGDEN